jgi:hypothetical protein
VMSAARGSMQSLHEPAAVNKYAMLKSIFSLYQKVKDSACERIYTHRVIQKGPSKRRG